MGKSKDPKYGAHKVTNTDEQEVAINQSSTQEGGYDEPVNQQVDDRAVDKTPAPQKPEEKNTPASSDGKGDRKRPYHEEENE
jgi:hypothetical protein